MIKFYQFAFFTFAFIFSLQCVQAQKTFHVSIQKPASMAGKEFKFRYDDGLEKKTVTDTFIHNTITFSGTFYSGLAVLEIIHEAPDSVPQKDEYFIGTEPGEIILREQTNLISLNFDPILFNVYPIYESRICKERNEFSKSEINDINQFMAKNGDSVFRVDSLKKIFRNKLYTLNNKDMEFIKRNGNDYFSFWYFRTRIIPYTYLYGKARRGDFENLLEIYNTVFAKSFKETIEGVKMGDFLTGRVNNHKGNLAQNFEAKDNNGKVVKISDLKGKFVLIDFWATWCGPCMEKVPAINKIRTDYSVDKLVIMGISLDRDYDSFNTGIIENKMNWVHIYGRKDIADNFGADAIPTTILIDKDGYIVYESTGNLEEELFELLRKM